jgi:integrase
MTTRVRRIIERRRLRSDGTRLGADSFILGGENGEEARFPRKAWWDALRVSGVARDPRGGWSLHFHDIRGEFASRLHEAGVDLVTIQKLLDHSTSAMTDRYLRVRVEKLTEAIVKLEEHNAILAAKLLEKGTPMTELSGTVH